MPRSPCGRAGAMAIWRFAPVALVAVPRAEDLAMKSWHLITVWLLFLASLFVYQRVGPHFSHPIAPLYLPGTHPPRAAAWEGFAYGWPLPFLISDPKAHGWDL